MFDLIDPSHSGPFDALPTVGREQRLRLDRIAQRRAGAVRLDRVDIGRRQPGVRQRLPDHPLLRRPVRRGQPVGRAVLIDRAAAHDGQHAMAVRRASDSRSSTSTPSALGEAGAVGAVRRTTCSARPARGRAGARSRRTASGLAITVTPPASASAHSPVAQRLARQMQRHERRRARRVDRHRRTLEPERVGDPAGHDARRACRSGRNASSSRGARACGSRVRTTPANTPVSLPRSDAGSMPALSKRLPGRLQQQPLLRVHRQRLARADPEEAGVELGRVVEEAAVAGVAGARRVGVRVVEPLEVPAAVRREVADRVASRGDQLPQRPRARPPRRDSGSPSRRSRSARPTRRAAATDRRRLRAPTTCERR